MNILEKIKKSKVSKHNCLEIKTIDMHTCGEPLRIIIDGYPTINGNTILEKRNYVKDNLDYLRTALMFEPRGHADMYGVILVQCEHKDSDFGVIFMHNEGYSTMCGHAIIALSKLAVKLNWVKVTQGITSIKIDAPCGQIKSYVSVDENSEVTNVMFECVPSFVLALNESIEVKDLGLVRYDLAYGGAFYAYVDAKSIKLSLDKNNYNKIISYGKQIKQSIIKNKQNKTNIMHPLHEDLSFLYGVIFIEESNIKGIHSKNVCVFANGEIDRSPTGSGVSGRGAILYEKKQLKINETIIIESILGSTFNLKIKEEIKYAKFNAIIPEVSGNAFITGEHTFLINKDDDLKYGFILR